MTPVRFATECRNTAASPAGSTVEMMEIWLAAVSACRKLPFQSCRHSYGGETEPFSGDSGNICAYEVAQKMLVSEFPAANRATELVSSQKARSGRMLRTKAIAKLETDFKTAAKSPDAETNRRCLNVWLDHL